MFERDTRDDSRSVHWVRFSSLVITRYVVTLEKKLPVRSDVSGSVDFSLAFRGCGSCLLLETISHLKHILIC